MIIYTNTVYDYIYLYKFYFLCIYFWLCWIFLAAWAFSSYSKQGLLSSCGETASLVVAYGL